MDRVAEAVGWVLRDDYSPKPAFGALRDLIATCDWIDHAIATVEELEGALNRLLSVDLVAQNGDDFAMPDSVRREFEAFRVSILSQAVLRQFFYRSFHLHFSICDGRRKPFGGARAACAFFSKRRLSLRMSLRHSDSFACTGKFLI